MPDPLRKTVSASQAAGLFNASPYVTRRALYDFFHDGVSIDERENESMKWGKAIEPFILGRARDKLALEVVPNFQQEYVRHGELPVGCTIDGRTTCPTRGLGIVQAKSVRWQVFKEDWPAGKAPLHIELQVQHEMLTMGASWGVIACMVGANEDFTIYERKPDERIYARLVEEAKRLMADVANNNRPPVFGEKIEMRGIDHIYPETVAIKRLDDLSDVALGQLLRDYDHAAKQSAFYGKAADQLKVKILDRTGDHGRVRVYAAEAKVTKTPVAESAVTLPGEIRSALMNLAGALHQAHGLGDAELAAITAAIDWRQVARKSYVTSKITVTPHDEDEAPQASGGFMIEGG